MESPISTTVIIVFSCGIVPYILAWKYIFQLVRDVNSRWLEDKVSISNWMRKGWKRHRQYFPMSPVRKRIAACIFLSVGFGFAAFFIMARSMILHSLATR